MSHMSSSSSSHSSALSPPSLQEKIPKSGRRTWSKVEDEALREAVRLFGSRTAPGSAWPAISRHVSAHGGRSNKDCRKRWFHSLDPGLKKGRWSSEEDAALRKAFLEVGPQWQEMALRVPGRTDEQVAKRWKDVLDTELKLDAPWREEEDIELLRLYKELGPKWTLISASIPTRNGIACRNRFRKFRGNQTDSNPAISPISEIPSNDSTISSTASDNPFFSVDNTSQEDDMSFLTDILGPQYSTNMFAEPFVQPNSNIVDQDLSFLNSLAGQGGVGNSDNTGGSSMEGGVGDAFLTNWLENYPSTSGFSGQVPMPETNHNEAVAIQNVWGLLVALESGQGSLNVSSTLIRQLLADAAKR